MDFDEKEFMTMSNLQNRLVHIKKLLGNENILGERYAKKATEEV
jgi:hypothetical protein